MDENQELSTNLTIGDLTTIASMIDAITARGALKSQELIVVGTIYEKIISIIKTVKATEETEHENKGNQDS